MQTRKEQDPAEMIEIVEFIQEQLQCEADIGKINSAVVELSHILYEVIFKSYNLPEDKYISNKLFGVGGDANAEAQERV